MVNKQRVSLSLSDYVAATKQAYLEAFQDGRIVVPDQKTRDWLVKSFAGIERYAEGLDKAVALSIGAFHGVSSWRVTAMFDQYREAVDELPETT